MMRNHKEAKTQLQSGLRFVVFFLSVLVVPITANSQEWTTSGTNISNANSGNVGVGTTTPGAKLDIRAGAAARGSHTDVLVGSGGDTPQIELFGSTKSSSIKHEDTNGLTFFTNAPSWRPTLTLAHSGNVGIGTTTPTHPLEIVTNQNAVTRFGFNNSSNGSSAQAAFSFFEGTTEKAKIAVNSSGASGYVGGVNAFQIWNFQNTPIVFGTNSAERMRIDAAGNVGLGVTGPTQKLDIDGRVKATGFCIGSDCRDSWTQFGSQWATNGPSINYTGGNVGIGITGPGQKLDVDGSVRATGFCIGGDCKTTFSQMGQWVTNGAAINYTGGNVGIGITGPGQKLDVDGSVRATGFCIGGDCRTTWAEISGGQWTTNGSTINYSGGNVGVNVTSPLKQLQVERTGTTSADYQLLLTAPTDHSAGNWTGINFGVDGYAGQYAKGGIIYEGRDGYNRGRLHFTLEGSADTSSAALSSSKMMIDYNGRVGIGTTSPTTALDVNGTVNATGLTVGGVAVTSSQWSANGTTIKYGTGTSKVGINTTLDPTEALDVSGNIRANGSVKSDGGFCIGVDCRTTWAQIGSSQWTTNGPNITYGTGGNFVGINNSNPTVALEVGGDIKASGTIFAKYQDVAEWVDSSQELGAATVVVLDTTKNNQVIASTQAYDSRIAGVISIQPGLTLGEGGEGRVLVATTGRVKVKVDASKGAIQIGDLLVTSDREGYAMKSTPVDIGGVRIHRPGTLIGKALEPLASGTGEILVLLSLQ